MYSDDNSEKLIMRLRIKDVDEEDEELPSALYLQEVKDNIIKEVTISGIPEISKVSFMKYLEIDYDPVTGDRLKSNLDKPPFNWLIDTDGVALQKVLSLDKVDFKRTTSNDI